MPQYFSSDFEQDAWSFITTHLFGHKYIAQRCFLTVKELRETLKKSNDPRELDDILFFAGAKIDVSIVDRLFVTSCTQVCRGSYRIIDQRMSVKTLVKLCNDFTDYGDISEGDVYRIIEILGKKLILINRSHETHVIEIKKDWVYFDKTQNILLKQTCNLQTEGGLSPLAIAVTTRFINDLDYVQTAQDYYKLINEFNSLACHFETSLPRVLIN